MSTSPIDDTLSASWWPELLSVKDTLSWAALSAKFGPSANTLRSALAAAGQSKAPMAPGRKPKNGAAASSPVAAKASVASPAPAKSSGKAPKASKPGKPTPVAKAAPAKAAAKPAASKAKPAEAAPVAAPADVLAPFRAKLGNAPDADVATLAGVSADDVKAYRRAHDIPAFRRAPPSRGGTPTEAPAAAVAPRGKANDADQVVRRRRASSDGAMNEVTVRTPAPERAPEPVAASAAPVGDAANPLEAFRDQLGKVADHVIAEQANVDRTVIGAWRRKLGVPAYDGFRHRKSGGAAAPAAAPKAAKKATVVAAAAPSATKASPADTSAATKGKPGRRSAIDAFFDIVGKLTDAEVAAKANVSVPAVTQYRIRRGIPAAGRSSAAKAAAAVAAPPAIKAASVPAQPAAAAQADGEKEVRHRRSKLDAHAHLVGVLSDAEVASLANVSSEGVRQYRRRHGISAASGRSQEEGVSAAPAPVSAPSMSTPAPSTPTVATQVAPSPSVSTPAPSTPSVAIPAPVPVRVATPVAPTPTQGAVNVAYSVVAHHGDESRRFVAVGVDIRDALGRAVSALDARADGPWVVQSVRRLCDALG
ncbi:MAG: hypothetical protein V4850_03105 [Myxococcota bacterium]